MNNAGLGIGAPIGELDTKRMDLQLATNLRAIPLMYRETLDMLKAAGAEHGNALAINTASIAGKQGEAWLSIYSATKFGVVGFTQSMNRELNGARDQVDGAVPRVRRHGDDRVRPRPGRARRR